MCLQSLALMSKFFLSSPAVLADSGFLSWVNLVTVQVYPGSLRSVSGNVDDLGDYFCSSAALIGLGVVL